MGDKPRLGGERKVSHVADKGVFCAPFGGFFQRVPHKGQLRVEYHGRDRDAVCHALVKGV